jgi:hypothetical protein
MSLNLYLNILPENQRILLEKMAKEEWISSFYLAGGTALALQIGHRQSIDFDFFTEFDFPNDKIIENLLRLGNFNLFSEERNTLHGELNNIKISFLGYKYPLLRPPDNFYSLKIACVFDIAMMKLSAISGGGTKKDFIDLYYILRSYTIEMLISEYHNKFGTSVSNGYHLLKSMAYFDDAENDPMPIMKEKIDWNEIKKHIIEEENKINF